MATTRTACLSLAYEKGPTRCERRASCLLPEGVSGFIPAPRRDVVEREDIIEMSTRGNAFCAILAFAATQSVRCRRCWPKLFMMKTANKLERGRARQ